MVTGPTPALARRVKPAAGEREMERSPIPEPVRRRLHSLSHNFFFTRERGEGQPLRCQPGQYIVSSLPLQMCLYFNVCFFPFWWVCEIVMLELKYVALNTYYRIVLSVLLVLMTIIEVIRLYLGYMGNLQEKVPELAGFWLLTLLLQLPMTLFHVFSPHLLLLPLEWGTAIVYLLFLAAEVSLAFVTLRRMVKQLEMSFHMMHFDSLETARGPGPGPDAGSAATERTFPRQSAATARIPTEAQRAPRQSSATEGLPRGGSLTPGAPAGHQHHTG